MGNGFLAELQRGMVARGLAAAFLLALPVGVAMATGFSPSASGLSEGLGSLASGPDAPPEAAQRDGSLDAAIVTAAGGPAADVPAAPGGDTPAAPGPEATPDPVTTAPGPDGPGSPGGEAPGGGPVGVPDPGEIVPGPGGGETTPAQGAADGLLGGIGDSLNSLLDGR